MKTWFYWIESRQLDLYLEIRYEHTNILTNGKRGQWWFISLVSESQFSNWVLMGFGIKCWPKMKTMCCVENRNRIGD